MMGVSSIAIWSGDKRRISKCPCLSGFVDNSLDLNVSFGANHVFWAEITDARIQYWKNQSRNGLVGLKLFAQDVYSGFTFVEISEVCNFSLPTIGGHY